MYGKKTKHQQSLLESFDPRPVKYHGTACASLKDSLQATKGMGLSTSVLFDKSARVWKPPGNDVNERSQTPLEYNIPSKKVIQAEVIAFKESLTVSEADVCRIERETRDQRDSLKWFQSRPFELQPHILLKSVDVDIQHHLMLLFYICLGLTTKRERTLFQ